MMTNRLVGANLLRQELAQFSPQSHSCGRFLYDLVVSYSLSRCMDIGLRSGLMTSYIATASSFLQDGEVTSLGIESQNLQASAALSVLNKLGFDKHLTIKYHPKSLSTLFLKLFLSDPREYLDLLHIHSGPAPQSMALLVFLAERSVKLGGWVVIDSRSSSGETQEPTATQMFRELLGISPYFSTFRRHDYLLLGRKIVPYTSPSIRRDRHTALVIGAGLARASEDLEFRLLLQQDPASALNNLVQVDFGGSSFAEASLTTPGIEQCSGEPLRYHLAETSWERKGRLESEYRSK